MALDIIIVGAGISGLCTAIALRRAGHRVQIFEKSRFATETGAAVSLAPNGVLVLEHLGFDFERAQACRHKIWEVMDGFTLKPITFQNLENIASITGTDYHTVHRVDLHKELLRLALDTTADNASTPPVKIHYGSPVSNVDALNGQVYLPDGTIHTADLVIAADGIHSTVRGCVVPSDSNTSNRAIETGMSAFRFLIPTETLEVRPEIKAAMRMKRGDSALLADTTSAERVQHMIWYGCRGEQVQNFVGIHRTREPGKSSGDARSDMLEEFGHFNPIVPEIIRLADDVKCWPLLIHEPLKTWIYYKVLLIGDAAHAMLPFGGQGANQAIEDAGAISILFQDLHIARDLPARLALFEEVRTKRASRVQVLSRVRVGKEKEVEEELMKYMEDGMDVPNTFASRLVHDSGFDVLERCVKELELA